MEYNSLVLYIFVFLQWKRFQKYEWIGPVDASPGIGTESNKYTNAGSCKFTNFVTSLGVSALIVLDQTAFLCLLFLPTHKSAVLF